MIRRTLSRTALCAAAIVVLMLSWQGCSKDDATTNNPVTPQDSVSDKARPVVFAHGFLEAADAWMPASILFVLNKFSGDSLFAIDFEKYITSTGVDVSLMASQLSTQIASIITLTGADRVDIVAHGIGAQAVQYYLTKMDGTKKVAHVAFLGGIFDPALTLDGKLTPGPVKYLAVRSNGQDATQNGDPAKGTLDGAVNEQYPDLDHQQLLTSGDAFARIFKFFTAKDASVKNIPAGANLSYYSIKGRVISFADNTPIANAELRFIYLKKGTSDRQSVTPSRIVRSDVNGYFTFTDQLNPYFDIEISDTATGYHDSHVYRQPWRHDTYFERIRMFPKSGVNSTAYLQNIMSNFTFTNASSAAIIHTPYRAIYSGRNQATLRVDIGEATDRIIDLVNPQTAPAPGAAGGGSNTFLMFIHDAGSNQSDGSGPTTGLSAFGLSSFDVFIYALSTLNYQSMGTLDGKTLYFKNWRSLGTSTNNRGASFLQFDYF
jgi:pimeloyl-ACP methyl ester carboxylesterase